MRIDSFNINMQANYSQVQKHESKVTIDSWTQNQFQSNELMQTNNFTLSISHTQIIFHEENNLSVEDKIKKEIIERLLGKLLSKKDIKLYPNKEMQKDQVNKSNPYTANISNTSWGFEIKTSEEYHHKSSVQFATQAQIKTSSGEFNIDVKFAFSQEFYEAHETTITFGTPKLEDPLIINYKDNMDGFDNISYLNFTFDINSDGKEENIKLLKDGAGFLALDKNRNGKIDNGNELFGPNSGNGFSDLKQYDKDNNNWIDENDSIFNHLRIWEKNDKNEDNLITLGQAGIGAIYLSGIKTDFNYHESIKNQSAQLKESSIFLKEDGKAGLITSVNFTV